MVGALEFVLRDKRALLDEDHNKPAVTPGVTVHFWLFIDLSTRV
jgi:hypothetical protein